MLLSAGSFVLALPIGVYEIPEVVDPAGVPKKSSLGGNSPLQFLPWSRH
jgi:hypothetical protein